jgi:hypothetical protein
VQLLLTKPSNFRHIRGLNCIRRGDCDLGIWLYGQLEHAGLLFNQPSMLDLLYVNESMFTPSHPIEEMLNIQSWYEP